MVSERRIGRGRKVGSAVMIAALGTGLALGASAAASSPPGTDAGTDSSGGTDLESVTAELDALIAGDVEFPRPEDPVDPGSHEIAVVASGLGSPGPARVATAVEEALEVIGWTAPPTYDGKFQPTEQAALISQAVADEADALILISITPSAVAAAVGEAQAAGIPIVCVLCGPDPITDGIINVQADAVKAGWAQAAYATVHSGGEGTIVVYHNEEFQFSAQQGVATVERLAEICPDCTVEERDILLLESREPNAPIWTALLQDFPEGELDFVLSPFDSPAGALANTASQLGRTDFGIVGYGALAPFVDMVGTGVPEVARASVTISTPYFGWSAVDQAARVLAGVPTWESDAMPVGLITMDNFADYPAGEPYLSPDFDYPAHFAEMWGK